MNAFLEPLDWVLNNTSGLFVLLVNMGMTATLVALAVMLARLVLKRAPKSFSYALWLAVGLRLLSPVTFRLPFSLLGLFQPRLDQATGLPEYVPYTLSGGGTTDQPILPPIPGAAIQLPNTPDQSVDPIQLLTAVLCGVWLCGIAALLVYSIVSYVKILRRVREATLLQSPEVEAARARLRLSRRVRVYESSRVDSPFVCGFLRPRIYLRAGLSGTELTYILTHELVHVKRFDYLLKPLAFLLLLLHWYNPVLWLAFRLMGKDQEMSCDERVIKLLGGDIRADYSESLLAIAAGRRSKNSFGLPLGTPLAFGESGVKGRIKNVLSYKKPTLWVVLAALAAVAALLVFLLADPRREETAPQDPLTGEETVEQLQNTLSAAPAPQYLMAVYNQRILPLEQSGLLEEPFENHGTNSGAARGEGVSPDGMVRYVDCLNVLFPGPDGFYQGSLLEAVCQARFRADAAQVRSSSFYDAEREAYSPPRDSPATPYLRSLAGPSWTKAGPAYYLAYFDSEEKQNAGEPRALYQVILDDSLLTYLSVRDAYPPTDWKGVAGWSIDRSGVPYYAEVLAINGSSAGAETSEDTASFYRQFIEPLYESGILAQGFNSIREMSPAETEELSPDSLLHFYALTTGWEDTSEGVTATISADEVENALQGRFYVSREWLRRSSSYDAASDSYKIIPSRYRGSPQPGFYELLGPGAGQFGRVYTVAYFDSEEGRATETPVEVYQVTIEDPVLSSHWPRYLGAQRMDAAAWAALSPSKEADLAERMQQLEAELAKIKENGTSSDQSMYTEKYREEIAALQSAIEQAATRKLNFRGEDVTAVYSLDFQNRAYHPVTDAAAMEEAVGLLSPMELQTVEGRELVGFLVLTEQGKYEFNFNADDDTDIVRLSKSCNAATAGVAQWLAYMSTENITRVTFSGTNTGAFQTGGTPLDLTVDTTDRTSIEKISAQLKRIPVEPKPEISTLFPNPTTSDMTMIELSLQFRSGVSYVLLGWGTNDGKYEGGGSFDLSSSDREVNVYYSCSPAQIDAIRDVVESLPETKKSPW